jgi:hypothetical protein
LATPLTPAHRHAKTGQQRGSGAGRATGSQQRRPQREESADNERDGSRGSHQGADENIQAIGGNSRARFHGGSLEADLADLLRE